MTVREYALIDGAELWAVHATFGFPIEFTIPLCATFKWVPTWDTFFVAAKNDGANIRRLADRVAMAVRDGYPKEFADQIINRFPSLLDVL